MTRRRSRRSALIMSFRQCMHNLGSICETQNYLAELERAVLCVLSLVRDFECIARRSCGDLLNCLQGVVLLTRGFAVVRAGKDLTLFR